MRRNLLSHRLLTILVGCLLTGTTPVLADFLLPNHNHTETVRNGTGKTANDLHVNLVHPATGAAPTAPPFTTAALGGVPAGTTIDFSGGTVAPGGNAVVNWQSKFASDRLNPADPGHWTFNGTNIGNVTIPYQARVETTDQGGGLVKVSLVNEGSTAINYSNLQIWRGADSAFFNPSNYLIGQSTGTAVGLMVATSGSFAPGTTDLAIFAPTLAPTTYNSGSALLNGDPLGLGSSSVPEPGSLTLGLLLVPAFYLAVRRRRTHGG